MKWRVVQHGADMITSPGQGASPFAPSASPYDVIASSTNHPTLFDIHLKTRLHETSMLTLVISTRNPFQSTMELHSTPQASFSLELTKPAAGLYQLIMIEIATYIL
jgi:hypothetical protein